MANAPSSIFVTFRPEIQALDLYPCPHSATPIVYTAVYRVTPMVYSGAMFEVKRTDAFDSWLKGLKDSKGRAKI